jgi:predicted nucleic acid-binding protein
MRVLLDTNVLLSFHFKDAEAPEQKAIDYLFSLVSKGRINGVISLVTFYQLLYFIDRSLRNPVEASRRAYAYLKFLELAPFNPTFLMELENGKWPDYEDGLQYACARSAECHLIVTTNWPDFFASKIRVIDPINFAIEQMDKSGI